MSCACISYGRMDCGTSAFLGLSGLAWAHEKHLHKDFDGDRIGQTVVQQLGGLSSPGLFWKVHHASEFPNGASDLIEAVLEEHCWVAISSELPFENLKSAIINLLSIKVNNGATSRLDAAIARRTDPSYNASSAITAYGVEARNENAL